MDPASKNTQNMLNYMSLKLQNQCRNTENDDGVRADII